MTKQSLHSLPVAWAALELEQPVVVAVAAEAVVVAVPVVLLVLPPEVLVAQPELAVAPRVVLLPEAQRSKVACRTRS